MIVVSDASPLINLARIGKLSLLQEIYGTVLVPDAVWHEVVIRGRGQAGAAEVESAGWVQRRAIADRVLAVTLQRDLNLGEAEAIVLALESDADLLVIDERLGRLAANRLGVRLIGLIGVLVAAKRRGLIERVKPQMDALKNVAGFRVDESLYFRVLRDEDET